MALFPTTSTNAVDKPFEKVYNYLVTLLNKWAATVWTSNNDGTGSGLDADTVDGKHASAFIEQSLATAANDFIVASGVGAFVKKTLAEAKTILLNNAYFLFAGPTASRTYTFPDADATIPAYSASTFTPTLYGGTTAGTGWAYTYQLGNYIKIGKKVDFWITLRASTIGTGAAGNLMIGNLPFTAEAIRAVFPVLTDKVAWPASMTQVVGYMPSTGGTAFSLYGEYNNGTIANVQVSGLSTGDSIYVSGSYQATT